MMKSITKMSFQEKHIITGLVVVEISIIGPTKAWLALVKILNLP